MTTTVIFSVEHFYLSNCRSNATGIMYILVDHLGYTDDHLTERCLRADGRVLSDHL